MRFKFKFPLDPLYSIIWVLCILPLLLAPANARRRLRNFSPLLGRALVPGQSLDARYVTAENGCGEHNHQLVFDEHSNCGEYHTCPNGMYGEKIPHKCPNGQYYNEYKLACDPNQLCANMMPKSHNLCDNVYDTSYRGEPEPEFCNRAYQCRREFTKTTPYFEYCPKGKIFNKARPQPMLKCIDGTCPPPSPDAVHPLPPGKKCDGHGKYHAHTSNCSQYYQCINCPALPTTRIEADDQQQTWCYRQNATCEAGHTFDEKSRKCVMGRCPQYPDLKPPEWKCKNNGDKYAVPNLPECNKFYTCVNCPDKPSTWCYTSEDCGAGQKFSDKRKECVMASRCPQLLPLAKEYNCTKKGEFHANINDCTKYIMCTKQKDEWLAEDRECPQGQTFHNIKKVCVPGRCPQCQQEAPKEWKCGTGDSPNGTHVHPDDCTQYYTCSYVGDCFEAEPYWGYELKQCGAGETFDDSDDTCKKGHCPNPLPPLPAGWSCKIPGSLQVNPDDCSEYYKCIWHQNKTWTYELKRCDEGKLFDNTRKICSATERCPNLPPRLPDYFDCVAEGDIYASPTECREYYKCLQCPDGGWCYQPMACQIDYYFDDMKKECLPEPCISYPPPSPPPPPPPAPSPSPSPPQSCAEGAKVYPDYGCCSCYFSCERQFVVVGAIVPVRKWCYLGYFNRSENKCYLGACPYK